MMRRLMLAVVIATILEAPASTVSGQVSSRLHNPSDDAPVVIAESQYSLAYWAELMLAADAVAPRIRRASSTAGDNSAADPDVMMLGSRRMPASGQESVAVTAAPAAPSFTVRATTIGRAPAPESQYRLSNITSWMNTPAPAPPTTTTVGGGSDDAAGETTAPPRAEAPSIVDVTDFVTDPNPSAPAECTADACPPSSAAPLLVSVAPEPASLVLVATGLGLLGLARRGRKDLARV